VTLSFPLGVREKQLPSAAARQPLGSLATTRSSLQLPALSKRSALDCFTFHVDLVFSRLMSLSVGLKIK